MNNVITYIGFSEFDFVKKIKIFKTVHVGSVKYIYIFFICLLYNEIY